MPAIAWWPGVIAPGTSSAATVFSTLMDVAGVPMPTDRAMDSFSFLPILRGQPAPPGKTRSVTFIYGGCGLAAVRAGHWKAHYNISKPGLGGASFFSAKHPLPEGSYEWPQDPVLYHLGVDPSEGFPVFRNSSSWPAELIEKVLLSVNRTTELHFADLAKHGTNTPALKPNAWNVTICSTTKLSSLAGYPEPVPCVMTPPPQTTSTTMRVPLVQQHPDCSSHEEDKRTTRLKLDNTRQGDSPRSSPSGTRVPHVSTTPIAS